MPPRKNIVRSGNAGNSSKSEKPTASAVTPSEPPLFPAGFKYPLSLLHERCQKLGWDKPIVETRSKGNAGHSFIVTLSRQNQTSASENDRVRMEPHPPYCRPTAAEARHWGATYALYRFGNGLQLHRTLPPGPREYWEILAEEHKKAPAHQQWMYDADPFQAQQVVEDRQAKAAAKQESPQEERKDKPRTPNVPNQFSFSPEVKMASSLREFVEAAIKQGVDMYPEAADSTSLLLSQESLPELTRQLGTLGFGARDIKDATTYLTQPSTLTSILLSSSAPLQACVEYLLLHVPECDLPERFLPSKNSSDPFVVSTHSGEHDIKTRWVQDKAVNEAGYPVHTVKKLTAEPGYARDWELLVAALGQKLIGRIPDLKNESLAPPFSIDPEEYEALGGHLESEGHLVLPLFSAPIQIHILVSLEKRYPRVDYLPIYLTSSSIPPYIRLALLSQLLLEMASKTELQDGEGFCMTIIQIVEAEWLSIEDNGRPDISEVLRHLVPQQQDGVTTVQSTIKQHSSRPNHRREQNRHASPPKVDRQALRKSDEYKTMLAARAKLPAYKAKDQFTALLEANRVVVVVGETGCGKTTQLPQVILDHMIDTDSEAEASIIVTQPRRISAISVAARVSQERLEDGSVGYAIRGESRQTKNTKILFCTTGVVLRRLSVGDRLAGASHVVVDEVHERSVDSDFLLLELKELLNTHATLKVVLMSATINHEIFSKYFNNAPLMSIPGFAHPVEDKYLEDVIRLTNYRATVQMKTMKDDKEKFRKIEANLKSQGLDNAAVSTIMNLVRYDRIDYQLIASLVQHIVTSGAQRGGILIFLPGVGEIRQCLDAIKKTAQNEEALTLPLHANLSNEEQRKVFKPTKLWKIIAATNVAETSITIDDVIYVIDTGKVKETQYDASTGLSCLVETQVSRAGAKQRRGRAGRTQPGICYKLFPLAQEHSMAPFSIPEILRVPLESVLLSVKTTREGEDVKEFLRKAIDPPSVEAIDSAWNILEDLGAINDIGGLTALGKHISMLPMDVRLAKMLILAVIFKCLSPIVTIVALLSSKPLFFSPAEKREEANKARQRFFYGNSDLLTDMKTFEECFQMQREGKSLRSFCEDNFVSMTTFREVVSLRQDLTSTLAEMELIETNAKPDSPHLNTGSGNINLLKAVMIGGLWPRVARVHLPDSAVKFDKVSAGTVRRDNNAKDFKMYDLQDGRVFLYPGSALFEKSVWKSPFLFYFHKQMTSKLFLRDASEAPVYGILLFGGTITISHTLGGITVGSKSGIIKLKAIPRIGTLVNQLRRLLDAQLQSFVDTGTKLDDITKDPVIEAIMALLENDGLTSQ